MPGHTARRYSVPAVMALLIAVGCNLSRHSTPTPTTAANASLAPDFAGVAAAIEPVSACPEVLPPDLTHPFAPGPVVTTPANYQLVGCWHGSLDGKNFTVDEYFSSELGGGIAVKYGDAWVARQMTRGAPVLVRFTGEYICDAEKAGAYFRAINVRTGTPMDQEQAQKVCPPSRWPPSYVLGLGAHHYPVDWHNTKIR